MKAKNFNIYLEDAHITLCTDQLPWKKFLHKSTLNAEVNNWAIEFSVYRIKFEFIKEVTNTL